MSATVYALLALAVAVVVGRLTVPGHPFTGWPGLYEFLAHAWVGAAVLMIYQYRGRLSLRPSEWLTADGWVVAAALTIATVFETVMFFVQNGVPQ